MFSFLFSCSFSSFHSHFISISLWKKKTMTTVWASNISSGVYFIRCRLNPIKSKTCLFQTNPFSPLEFCFCETKFWCEHTVCCQVTLPKIFVFFLLLFVESAFLSHLHCCLLRLTVFVRPVELYQFIVRCYCVSHICIFSLTSLFFPHCTHLFLCFFLFILSLCLFSFL